MTSTSTFLQVIIIRSRRLLALYLCSLVCTSSSDAPLLRYLYETERFLIAPANSPAQGPRDHTPLLLLGLLRVRTPISKLYILRAVCPPSTCFVLR